MPHGDSGHDGPDPSPPEESGKGGEGSDSVSSERRGPGEGTDGAAPEDVEMTGGPQDLSSPSAHLSARSTACSTSTHSSKSGAGSSSLSLHSALSGQAGRRAGTGGGSERTEAGGGRARREMMATMAEMKSRLPSDKRSRWRRKGGTVDALRHALDCVKQVQAKGEYHKLVLGSGPEEERRATGCSLEELERVLSEHTLKNTDSFVVLFSLADGRVKYASEQTPSILHCKRKFLESAKFVELLFHQDVNVFYSHTAQPHLPPWSNSRSAAAPFEYAQVKSFFCRVRGGKDRDGEMHYNPFRITPYLQMVQGEGGVEEDPCCLVLAERIISGYEAPRIPTDKRIFTTTHSPGCVFLEVDDRAVPLLGYLPQDLIGTSLLTRVHPEDRLLVLAMHRKVLKHAGRPPFEHAPLRLRCQSGDHVTLDTSWSSFVNPWSRKVAFIIGRHKVRTSPLNEDVFAARSEDQPQVSFEEVKGLQAMIYKLFQKPVHNKGSSGYGSLVSNGSHEHLISVASSSDSNGNLWEDSHREPMTLRQICADVNKVKSWGQQAYLDSRSKLPALGKPATAPPLAAGAAPAAVGIPNEDRKPKHPPSYQQINCVDGIIRYLESCRGPALKRKSYARSVAASSSSSTSEDDKPAAAADTAPASSDVVPDRRGCVLSAAAVVGPPLAQAMSVVSATSHCSFSSTTVHVPPPDPEVTALEDAPMDAEPADPPPAGPASEELRWAGLTKEVLSEHTEKEERVFVDRFRHRILRSPYSSYLQQDDGSAAHSHPPGDQAMLPGSAGKLTGTRTRKPKHKRAKAQDWSHDHAPRAPLPPHSSWPSSESSQPHAPQLQTPVFTLTGAQTVPGPERPPRLRPAGPPSVLRPDPAGYGFAPPDPGAGLLSVHAESDFQSFESIQVQNLQNIHRYPTLQPVAPALAVSPYVDPAVTPVVAVLLPSYPPYYPAVYPPPAPPALPTPTFSIAGAGPYPQPQPQFLQPPDLQGPTDPLSLSPGASSSFGGEEEEGEEAGPPALFSSSRSSSPLQLNLLQEELPGAGEGFQERHGEKGEALLIESGPQDSQSSEQLDLQLLQEDARSGTGSSASSSGSWASGSNGTSSSHTGSSSSTCSAGGSSDTSPGALGGRQEPAHHQLLCFDPRTENHAWNRHTPEHTLMTYQIHSRDQREVLEEDRARLRLLLPRQPWFTREQKEELWEVHPWILQRTLPPQIDTQGCVSCFSGAGERLSSRLPATDPSPTASPQQDT